MEDLQYCSFHWDTLSPFQARIVERGRKIHEEKKTRGDWRGKGGERTPGVQLNSLPTYRCALLSERLEQARIPSGASKRHRTYPICDDPLSRRRLASLQNSCRNQRYYE